MEKNVMIKVGTGVACVALTASVALIARQYFKKLEHEVDEIKKEYDEDENADKDLVDRALICMEMSCNLYEVRNLRKAVKEYLDSPTRARRIELEAKIKQYMPAEKVEVHGGYLWNQSAKDYQSTLAVREQVFRVTY